MSMLFLFFASQISCSSQKNIDEGTKIEPKEVVSSNTKKSDSKVALKGNLKHISVPELFQLYQMNKAKGNEIPLIIDVRTKQEYERSHIPTAQHISLQEIGQDTESHDILLQNKDKEIYLVCAIGRKSGQAGEILLEKGFKKPINVMGGTNGWIALGFPIEKTKQSENKVEKK